MDDVTFGRSGPYGDASTSGGAKAGRSPMSISALSLMRLNTREKKTTCRRINDASDIDPSRAWTTATILTGLPSTELDRLQEMLRFLVSSLYVNATTSLECLYSFTDFESLGRLSKYTSWHTAAYIRLLAIRLHQLRVHLRRDLMSTGGSANHELHGGMVTTIVTGDAGLNREARRADSRVPGFWCRAATPYPLATTATRFSLL